MTTTWGLTAAYLCSAQVLSGELKEAADSARMAQPVLRSIDLEALLIVHVALLGVHSGRPAEAARSVGWSRAWYAANHNAPDGTVERLHRLAEADVEAALGSAEAERLRAEGAAMVGQEPGALLRSVLGADVRR